MSKLLASALAAILAIGAVVTIGTQAADAYDYDAFARAALRESERQVYYAKMDLRGVRQDRPGLQAKAIRGEASALIQMRRWLRNHRPDACQAKPTKRAIHRAGKTAYWLRKVARHVEREQWSAAAADYGRVNKHWPLYARNIGAIYRCG